MKTMHIGVGRSVEHSLLAAACGLLVLLFAFPLDAKAQCKQWDISGAWSINQADNITVYMNLRQSGTKLIGSADYSIDTLNTREPVMILGSAKGEIVNNNYSVKIRWTNPKPQVGDYTASIGSNGILKGSVSVGAGRGVEWSSNTPMKCLSR